MLEPIAQSRRFVVLGQSSTLNLPCELQREFCGVMIAQGQAKRRDCGDRL